MELGNGHVAALQGIFASDLLKATAALVRRGAAVRPLIFDRICEQERGAVTAAAAITFHDNHLVVLVNVHGLVLWVADRVEQPVKGLLHGMRSAPLGQFSHVQLSAFLVRRRRRNG